MEKFLVSASTGAMTSLVGKLGNMLRDEYKLLKDVRGDIEFLKDELEAMQAFLIVMADVQEPNHQEKLRADAVREMSYEIEDNIDKFMILVEREPSSKSHGGFVKLFNRSMEKVADIKARHKIAKDIKGIKNQVEEINGRYRRYKIDGSSGHRNKKVDPRLCAMYKDASELVGIDGPRDELVKWLSNKGDDPSHQPKVVSIVGCGGLGKTTLAKQVYDKLGAAYECHAFVSISRTPDMAKILSSILFQLGNQDYAHSGAGDDPQLIIDQIRGYLKGKRYFIIIDDIWDVQTWQTLNCALLKNSWDNAILTTTRIHDVAKSCCSSQGALVYRIQPLSVPDSKRLFFNRIFGCEENCPPNLKEASEDILKRCGGLPLAINTISSLLATGKTKEEWDRVRSSIGFAEGKNPSIDAMNYILSLSYIDLPLHLRSCLLYLAMFPEDCWIERLQLVLLWISEGFIHGEDGKDLVELGETYFHELVNRSLIQPEEIRYDDKARYCRVHDTVLDFLIYRCSEENFCTLLRNHSKPGSRVRRLSLMGNEDQESVKHLDLSYARSIIAFLNAKHFPSLVKSNALRVLDLQKCRGLRNHHVKDVGKLLQLRYLSVACTDITELPRQIGDLKYLETLDASDTKLVEIPESATRLPRLLRLFVPYETKFPDGVGNLKNLQELERVDPLKQSLNFLEELGKLTNLRKLGILWYNSTESGKASLKEGKLASSLRKLDECNLSNTRVVLDLTENRASFTEHAFLPALNSIRDVFLLRGKLSWITNKWLLSLANLEILCVQDDDDWEIEQRDVEMVGRISTLLKFDVWSSSRGQIVIGGTGGFHRLQELSFYVTDGLVFEAGAMPNLKELGLRIDLSEFTSAARGRGRGFASFGVHHLSGLARFRVRIFCDGVTAADMDEAEGALRSMAETHPNHPTLEVTREHTDDMYRDDEVVDDHHGNMPQYYDGSDTDGIAADATA